MQAENRQTFGSIPFWNKTASQNGTHLYLPNKIGTSQGPTSGDQVRTGPGWHISMGFSREASAGELLQPGIGGSTWTGSSDVNMPKSHEYRPSGTKTQPRQGTSMV